MIRVLLITLTWLTVFSPQHVRAHALDPGFLEITPFGATDWRVTWRKPQVQGQPMQIDAILPEGCTPRRGGQSTFDGRAFLAGWVASCENGLAGGQIRIDGLENTRTDVLVRYSLAPDRQMQTQRLTAATPAFVVPAELGAFAVGASYIALGIDHILKGIDHLLFVLMLLLLVREWRPLLAAVTFFTVGHSLSLGAASLGWIVVPAPPVEVIVALSIAFLAAELLNEPNDQKRLSQRYPWAVAFAFGLLHGLGFARALLDLGLPEGDVPLALFAFNVGVEIGQIMFIALVVGLIAAFWRLYPSQMPKLAAPRSKALQVIAYSVGTLAIYWSIERLAGFIT